MPPSRTWDSRWPQLSALIAERLGLHFPPERQSDLERGLNAAAKEFGLADAEACADWLLSASLSRTQLHVLASHLTVGETYFFRERKAYDALATHVIPELVLLRSAEKRLRLWSAACCTGEEAYSLAILLRQCIPDWQHWHVTILATDVNERSLHKAAAGVYGEWSFREAAPGFKQTYFTRLADGRYALQPQFKQWVKLMPLNLAEDGFPSLDTDTAAMDLIFCRNVLMYFTPRQALKVAGNLRRALRDDGWLVISAGDGSQALSDDFTPVSLSGTILYRKKDTVTPPGDSQKGAVGWAESSKPNSSWRADPLGFEDSAQPTPVPPTVVELPSLVPILLEAPLEITAQLPVESGSPSQRARSLANEGKLEEALSWCDQWIAEDASEAAARYLRAIVLQELGHTAEAHRSLQQALYLHPQFVLAHFALGNLARADGRHDEARRHFNHTLELLRDCAPEELLPESDGLTAGRLEEILTALLALEAAA